MLEGARGKLSQCWGLASHENDLMCLVRTVKIAQDIQITDKVLSYVLEEMGCVIRHMK